MERTDYNGRINIIQPDTTTLLGMSDKIHTPIINVLLILTL